MTLVRIQIPKHVFGIILPGSRRLRFTTKINEERIRPEREDQKSKLAFRSLQRRRAGHRFHKEMEKSEGVVRLRDFFLGELAVQENTELPSNDIGSQNRPLPEIASVGNIKRRARDLMDRQQSQ
jgi:hypothetical protein